MAQTSIEDPKTAEAAPEETEAATLSTGATMSTVTTVTPDNPTMDHTNRTGGEAGAALIRRARTVVDTKDMAPKTSPLGTLSEAKSHIRKLNLKTQAEHCTECPKYGKSPEKHTTSHGIRTSVYIDYCHYSLMLNVFPPPWSPPPPPS